MAHAHASSRLEIDPRRLQVAPDSGLRRLPWIAGGIGVLAAAASAALGTERFYYAWLVWFLFFLSIALGGLFFTMFCLFARFLPVVAAAEVKSVLPLADPHAGEEHVVLAPSKEPAREGAV